MAADQTARADPAYPGIGLISDRLRRRLLNFAGARIHPTATVHHSCWLDSADIVMGRDAMLNCFARFDGAAQLTFEDGARVSSGVTFTTSTHHHTGDAARCSSPETINAPITIKAGCWVMTDVTISPGVTIGGRPLRQHGRRERYGAREAHQGPAGAT